MKPIDIHTHLLNHEITPASIYFNGREWDLETISPILYAWTKWLDPIDDIAEWIVSQFAGKTIDSDKLAKVFFTPLSEQWKLFEAMPCTPNVMTIDFRTDRNDEDQAERHWDAWGMASSMAYEIGAYWSEGVNPIVTGHEVGDCSHKALKAYPAMWELDSFHWDMCAYSQRLRIPIITHASQGGIGRNKANNHPLKWWDALMQYPESVICFAHAIGYSDADWEVIERMALEFRFPDGRPRIYVDTAFIEGAIYDTTRYMNRFRKRYNGNAADGIMFGSDWPLHLAYGYTQADLLDVHRKHLGAEIFDVITQDNPRRFLGVK